MFEEPNLLQHSSQQLGRQSRVTEWGSAPRPSGSERPTEWGSAPRPSGSERPTEWGSAPRPSGSGRPLHHTSMSPGPVDIWLHSFERAEDREVSLGGRMVINPLADSIMLPLSASSNALFITGGCGGGGIGIDNTGNEVTFAAAAGGPPAMMALALRRLDCGSIGSSVSVPMMKSAASSYIRDAEAHPVRDDALESLDDTLSTTPRPLRSKSKSFMSSLFCGLF